MTEAQGQEVDNLVTIVHELLRTGRSENIRPPCPLTPKWDTATPLQARPTRSFQFLF